MSFTRIGSNLAAAQSFNALMSVNREIGIRLLRLSTGKRINSVGDDAAGFSLARGLESRRRSLTQALENVGNAKNVLAIAEGGYLAIADLLQIIKEKSVQGADDSFSSDQRNAIQAQIDSMVAEINDIVAESNFQGAKLIDGSFSNRLFQTGAGAGETFAVNLAKANASAFTGFASDSTFEIKVGSNDTLVIADTSTGLDVTITIAPGSYTTGDVLDVDSLAFAIDAALTASSLGATAEYVSATGLFTISGLAADDVIKWTSSALGRVLAFDVSADETGSVSYTSGFAANALSVASSASAAAAMENIDAAINTLNAAAQAIGEFLIRLSSKEETLAVTITNTEAARSRIEDADFAKEQLDLVRFQIIQQTAFSSFAQANTAPQLVLSLFR